MELCEGWGDLSFPSRESTESSGRSLFHTVALISNRRPSRWGRMRWESINSESILESANVESARDKKCTRWKWGMRRDSLDNDRTWLRRSALHSRKTSCCTRTCRSASEDRRRKRRIRRVWQSVVIYVQNEGEFSTIHRQWRQTALILNSSWMSYAG